MKTESCRDWRASLGAYSLGHLSNDERVGLEAHLEGCPDCRAEIESLTDVAKLLAFADPAHFGPAPKPSPELGERIAATIGEERKVSRRRRQRRFGLAVGGAVATAAAVFAIVFLPGGSTHPERQYVKFNSVPPNVTIAAQLEPHAFGTEIRMYVKGIRSGTLCEVYLRNPNGATVSAGTFRYRWGDDSQAVLSSALDLSSTKAIEVHAGGRTFVAPVDKPANAA
jgi:hypothetical protein